MQLPPCDKMLTSFSNAERALFYLFSSIATDKEDLNWWFQSFTARNARSLVTLDLISQQGNWSQMYINYLREQNLTCLVFFLSQSSMQSFSFPVPLFLQCLSSSFLGDFNSAAKSESFSSHLSRVTSLTSQAFDIAI